MSTFSGTPAKVGAGFLICCDGSFLLLRRSETSGNPCTWGLPGGNADPEDGGQLLNTAKREAREELGKLPDGLCVLGSVLTRRGKGLKKHYTVFVASITGATRAAYCPTLNNEHTEWRWLDLRHAAVLAAAPGAQPRVSTDRGFLGNREEDGAATSAVGAPPGDMALHPIVKLLFSATNSEALGKILADSSDTVVAEEAVDAA